MRDERPTTRIRIRRGVLALAGSTVALAALLSTQLALGQTTTTPAPTAAATAAPAATATPARIAPTLPPGAVVVTSPTPAAAATAVATAVAPTAAPVEATATATVEVVGFRSTTAQLGEIVWARRVDDATGEPVSRATGFITTDAVIAAAIPVQRIVSGVTISGQWSYDGRLVSTLTTQVTTIADARPGWLVFQLALPAGQIWPIGGYVLDIYVDGQFALTSSVIVSVPPPS